MLTRQELELRASVPRPPSGTAAYCRWWSAVKALQNPYRRMPMVWSAAYKKYYHYVRSRAVKRGVWKTPAPELRDCCGDRPRMAWSWRSRKWVVICDTCLRVTGSHKSPELAAKRWNAKVLAPPAYGGSEQPLVGGIK